MTSTFKKISNIWFMHILKKPMEADALYYRHIHGLKQEVPYGMSDVSSTYQTMIYQPLPSCLNIMKMTRANLKRSARKRRKQLISKRRTQRQEKIL